MKSCAVIGGGISGMSAAYFWRKRFPNSEITVFEASARLGGVLRTDTIDGCVIDGGPDSFLTQKKTGPDLCRDLGLQSELLPSNDAIRKTFIVNEGALTPLPDGLFLMIPTALKPLISTRLISWPGKFAALNDLFANPAEEDCTVSEFMQQRFGTEITIKIAEPLLSGIYGADIARLGMKSALPQIWEQQKRGSLILQMMDRKPKSSGDAVFTSLRRGMESLIPAMATGTPGVNWKMETKVDRVGRDNKQWSVEGSAFDYLILSGSGMPIIETPQGSELKRRLESVRRNSAIVVALIYEDVQRDGFGWLVPAGERRTVLACTYLSNKFSGRTSANRFVVRAFIGGSQALRWMDREDDAIAEGAVSEIRRIAGIQKSPLFYSIYRWKESMPEYEVGHQDKMMEIQRLADSQEKLLLVGNLWNVGLSDCIRRSRAVVDSVQLTGH